MLYMNDYDLSFAYRRFSNANCPNRLALVLVVDALRRETNMVSDGWAYWTKPCRAAKSAIQLIYSTTNAANAIQESQDITEEEMQKALRQIKSFLTRHASVYGAAGREIILRPVTMGGL